MVWDSSYQQAVSVWGEKPDLLLLDLAPLLPKGRVLDLGMGEGRNVLFFAAQGYDVRGIDLSPTAVQKCLERAQILNVTVQAEVQDIREVVIEPNSLALVICAMSLQFMKYADSAAMLHQIKAGLQPDGFVYLTVFSTEDPSYERLKQTGTPAERGTFFSQRLNDHIHFFEQEELMLPMEGLKLHRFSQTVMLDHGHPGVPEPHYHGILTYIGQRA